MRKLLFLLPGSCLALACVSQAAIYIGPSNGGFFAQMGGNLAPAVSYTISVPALDAPLSISVENGKIQFPENSITFNSTTFSGVQSFLDPVTLQNKSISYSITTDPFAVDFLSSPAMALTSSSFGLNWENHGSTSTPYTFSGTFTLTGPTQTVTGSFSYSLAATILGTSGGITSADATGINVGGMLQYTGLARGDVLIDKMVDGIEVNLTIDNVAGFNLMSPVSTNFAVVPEASSAALAALGGLALLRRRR